jgi:hypothetical protein
MQDGALGNGGAFASAPFGRPPGQRTAGQTLKPSSRPLPKTQTWRRPARHDCPGRHRNPASEDPGGICEQAAGHRAPGNLLRAEQTLLEPRLATAPGRTACILIHDPRHGTRYAAMSYVGPPRLRMVRLRGRRPSVTRHGAADAYSADAPEPPPRSWSQRVVEARCQDARGPRRSARQAASCGSVADACRSGRYVHVGCHGCRATALLGLSVVLAGF